MFTLATFLYFSINLSDIFNIFCFFLENVIYYTRYGNCITMQVNHISFITLYDAAQKVFKIYNFSRYMLILKIFLHANSGNIFIQRVFLEYF